jgi:hypothetical protein
MAKAKMAAKGTGSEKTPKDVAESKLSFKKSDWPLQAKVQYTAQRVAEHVGMTGVIIGYRPTNGLWVRFPNGKGSISVKTAKLLGGKVAKVRKPKSAPAEAISGASDAPEAEPTTE